MTRRNAILHVTKTVVGMFSMDIKISKCMNNVEKYIKLFLGSKMLTGPNLTDVLFARYRSKNRSGVKQLFEILEQGLDFQNAPILTKTV
jgi:hypothetical protein